VYGSRTGSGAGPGGARVLPVADALADAEVVLLAVPGGAIRDVISANGAALAGQVVIDAVNRIGEPDVSSRADVEAAAPTARYVRAFSTLGWENFADPAAGGADLFFAAGPAARDVAEELIRAVGLGPEFVGGPDAASTVDGVLPLWFSLVQQHGGNRTLAFRVVR